MIGLLVGVGLILQRDYRAELAEADLLARNATLGYQRLTESLIARHRDAATLLAASWSEQTSTSEIQAQLAEMVAMQPFLLGARLHDADGNLIASSDDPSSRMDFPELDVGSARLAVGAPQRHPSGTWVLPLKIPISVRSRTGSYMALWLDTRSIETILRQFELGAESSAVMLHKKGVIVSRSLDHERTVGNPVRDPVLVESIFDGPAVRSFFLTSLYDDVERRAMFRKLEGLPLAVAAGASKSALLAPWYRFVLMAGASTGLLIMALGAFLVATKRYNQKLDFRRTHDSLTNLPNRNAVMEAAAALSQPDGANASAIRGVIYADLDKFELINASLGYEIGDAVLQAVASRLINRFGSQALVGRFASDAFVVLPGANETESVASIAEAVRTSLREPFEVGDTLQHLTCSVGYASVAKSGSDLSTVLKNAELAMGRARQRGRDQVVAYSPRFQTAVTERIALVSRLRTALDREEFVLHFQPKHDAHSGAVVAVEALVRWQHPEEGLIGPVRFIEACEQSGLIVPLGRWILDQALKSWQELERAGHGRVAMAINIAPAQFEHGALHQDLERLIQRYRVPGNCIELELTETTVVKQPQTARNLFAQLRDMGVRVALDDFGTGYSSLAYLQTLPIDVLKIDKCFVAGLPDAPGAAAICQTVIALAANLNLEVVAEGVETPAQRDWLRDNGCQLLQGYLLTRPMPAAGLLEYLAGNLPPPKAVE